MPGPRKELARGGMTLSELAPLAVEELEKLLRQGRERTAPARARRFLPRPGTSCLNSIAISGRRALRRIP
jgi:hypothetical protein